MSSGTTPASPPAAGQTPVAVAINGQLRLLLGVADALDAGNVRKMFKRVCAAAGVGDHWTPRELRTSFVCLMSHSGVSIEEIARLAGHASTRTTEVVYRRELRPVITTGAEIMDQLFAGN